MATGSPPTSYFVTGRKPLCKYEGEVKKCYKSDVEYAAFLGIPYAAVPSGATGRYQAPKSLPSVELGTGELTTYKADVTGKVSLQLQAGGHKCTGSADCLYLNIFVPTRYENGEKLLPVLVFIHGGGFVVGDNDHEEYPPDSFVSHGLVFVTINYRLGMFGFLNTRTRDCPGNAGLKDQVKALEWIRDNIESFRGDPNNVTICGSSAGATCVNLHLVSPASRDLFHKAIIQSGGIFCPWGYRGHRYELTKKLLKDRIFRALLFDEPSGTNALFHTTQLIEKDAKERHPESFSPYFGPTVEKFEDGAFIPENIEAMMRKVDHKKPVMAGITKEEGIGFLIGVKNLNVNDRVNKNRRFLKLLMDNLRWDEKTAEKYMEKIRRKYFPNRFTASIQEMTLCFTRLARDIAFRRFYDNFKFGPEQTVHENLYVYRFDHVSEISAVNFFPDSRLEQFNDATHGDETQYLCCPTDLKETCGEYIYPGGQKCNETIQEVMNHLSSLWANFCKAGNPKSDFDTNNVEWKPHTKEAPCFLAINKNLELKGEPLFKDEWDWWNTLVNPKPKSKNRSTCVTPDIPA